MVTSVCNAGDISQKYIFLMLQYVQGTEGIGPLTGDILCQHLQADSERIASVPFRQYRQLYYLFGAQIKTLLYSKVEYGGRYVSVRRISLQNENFFSHN